MQKQEISQKTAQLSSNEKGTHAELLAAIALHANGWAVSTPFGDQAYDLSFRRVDSKRTYYGQVKTAQLRDSDEDKRKYNGEWIVVKGAKNNGERYSQEEVDYFLAVWDGKVYMFPNEMQREYWCRPWLLGEKWTELKIGI